MNERVAIIDGIRTPFCKAGGVFSHIQPDDLAVYPIQALMAKTDISYHEIDEVIFGNVLQPAELANIARIIAVKAGFPIKTPAYTVNRNCASGLEAIASASQKIWLNLEETILAGGTESMSRFPILFPDEMRIFLSKFSKAKNWKQKFAAISMVKPSMFIPNVLEIGDPLCGLNMGQTAELVARDYHITRQEQDQFSLMSQKKAWDAIENGKLSDEICPIPISARDYTMQVRDDGVRQGQTLDALAKLKPVFDPVTGTVTAGSSSQVTDGAVALLLMKESKAKAMGIKPLGFFKSFAVTGLDPSRMGMGPAYSIGKLLKQTGMSLSDFDLIEINEAFASQVLASIKALASAEFCQKELNLTQAVGEMDQNKLNVNGGAIAIGHPIGATGARLVLTLLKELKRRKKHLGLVSLCVGGGLGEAAIVEVEE